MRELIYVTKADALANGMTHEGTLFGVPAWRCVDSEEQVTGTPKIPALHLWCWVIDQLLELTCCLLPQDCELVSPITVGGEIEP
ncbi:hypothetical protein HGQ62_01625 [Stenotrophomonas maltophilia]|uniref:hypothetical protein n=1 Tax=Stenotrophomonas sp. CASM110 TaxID=3111510 RepID=UPI00146CF893|nr:hypothetical protein [Stenotrophomonas maltophilia]NMT71806.1 hypothetical protein [Stenotrophomonas maltophilia]